MHPALKRAHRSESHVPSPNLASLHPQSGEAQRHAVPAPYIRLISDVSAPSCERPAHALRAPPSRRFSFAKADTATAHSKGLLAAKGRGRRLGFGFGPAQAQRLARVLGSRSIGWHERHILS